MGFSPSTPQSGNIFPSNPIQDIGNAIKSAAGLGPSGDSGSGEHIGVEPDDAFAGQLGSAYSSYFWAAYGIDGSGYNIAQTYQLIIHGKNNQGQPIKHRAINFWLPPSNIDIRVPVAVATTVTMQGVSEDYNGAPLRMISIRGTAGIIPGVNAAQPTAGGPNNLLQSLFKNTIQSVGRTVAAVNNVVSSVQSVISGQAPAASHQLNHDSSFLEKKSGYYWIHSLGRLLDGYLEMKRMKRFKGARLCFVMHKDHMFYDCTLNSYSIRKVAGTLDYEYSIELTAWRRRQQSPDATPNLSVLNAAPKSYFNQIASATAALKNARLAVAAAVGVLSGIRSDIDTSLIQPLREAVMLGTDISNATQTLLNFPQTLIAGMAAPLVAAWSDLKATNPTKYDSLQQDLASVGVYGTSATESPPISNATQMPGPVDQAATTNASQSGAQSNQGLVAGDPLNDVINNPNNYATILDQFSPDDLTVSSNMQAKINAELQRVRDLTAEDWQSRRDGMQSYMASIEEAFGGGNATYNRVNGLPAPKTTYRKLAVADIELLSSLNDALIAADTLIASMQNNDQQSTSDDYAAYYASVARANGITFQDSASKFLVPFPYDTTLEQLAIQYLGDSDRWIEIAAINGLRPPYIDEVGFQYPLIGSGSGNTAIFSNSENLYVGQQVLLSSGSQPPSPRAIKSMDVLSSIEVVITFDGDPDLNRFLVSDNAVLKAYLPNTVNSLKLIAIPSADPVNVPGKIQLTPGIKDIDTVTLMAGRDFLLTSDGDLAMLGSGDIQTATGIANMIQAGTMKLLTPLGALLNDIGYGNPIQSGMPVSDLSAKDSLRILQQVFADDARFGPILASSISIQGPAVPIKLLVSVNGTSLNLPFVTSLPV